MERKSVRLLCLVAIVVLALGTLISCEGQKSAGTAKQVDFPTKEITWVIPTSAGGGFDTMSRILAPFLQKYLPNNPNIVVKNVAGGEWAMGINEVYNANPDGYTVAIFNLPGNVIAQIMGTAKYDLTKITWIGRITTTPYVAVTSPQSKLRTLDDLRKVPELKIASTGLSTSAGLGSFVAAQGMGLKHRFINHKGSSEALLSTMRGDADFAQFPYGTVASYVIDSKDLVPLWVYDKQRIPTLPDVPTIGEIGYPEMLDSVTLHYLVGTTPGTPTEVAQILRDAFDKAMSDPELVKKMETSGDVIKPGKAADAEATVKNNMEQYAKYKDALTKATQ